MASHPVDSVFGQNFFQVRSSLTGQEGDSNSQEHLIRDLPSSAYTVTRKRPKKTGNVGVWNDFRNPYSIPPQRSCKGKSLKMASHPVETLYGQKYFPVSTSLAGYEEDPNQQDYLNSHLQYPSFSLARKKPKKTGNVGVWKDYRNPYSIPLQRSYNGESFKMASHSVETLYGQKYFPVSTSLAGYEEETYPQDDLNNHLQYPAFGLTSHPVETLYGQRYFPASTSLAGYEEEAYPQDDLNSHLEYPAFGLASHPEETAYEQKYFPASTSLAGYEEEAYPQDDLNSHVQFPAYGVASRPEQPAYELKFPPSVAGYEEDPYQQDDLNNNLQYPSFALATHPVETLQGQKYFPANASLAGNEDGTYPQGRLNSRLPVPAFIIPRRRTRDNRQCRSQVQFQKSILFPSPETPQGETGQNSDLANAGCIGVDISFNRDIPCCVRGEYSSSRNTYLLTLHARRRQDGVLPSPATIEIENFCNKDILIFLRGGNV